MQFNHRTPVYGQTASTHFMSVILLGMVLWFCLFHDCTAESADAKGLPRTDGGAYDYTKDPFYRKRSIRVTWIMIWNGSTEKWWKPSGYHGSRILVEGKWVSTNWSDKKQIEIFCRAIRDAGIDVIAIDFTNGFRWAWQAQIVQEFCSKNDMKMVVAFNPQNGKGMESGCKIVWRRYASSGSSLSTYLHKNGKPLIVLYTTRGGYERSLAVKGDYCDRFTTVWASGEQSAKDKWGWQLDPDIGPVPSADSMFVTGSVKRYGPKRRWEEWRRHISWLDYGFVLAQRHNPQFLIVGSFDDLRERNAWFVADTTDSRSCLQTRDKHGAVSRDAYYSRVKQWLADRPEVVKGGLLPDGAYLVRSSNGKLLSVETNRDIGARAVLNPYKETLDHYIWFYHLGSNVYRLIKLNAGLALESRKSKVLTAWDSEAPAQRWSLEKRNSGYRLLNRASGKALAFSGPGVITETSDHTAPSQYWSIIEKAVISESQDKREQDAAADADKPGFSPFVNNNRKRMDNLAKVIQAVIALGILNVWILRFGRSTNWRGGSARNMTEEFAVYGLPRWFMLVIGFLKVSLAGLLIAGIWRPQLVPIAGGAMAALMLGAVLMHAKVQDPLKKSAPAAAMLVLALLTILLPRLQ